VDAWHRLGVVSRLQELMNSIFAMPVVHLAFGRSIF